MWLISMNEWLGPGNRMSMADQLTTEAKNTPVSFYSELPLHEALARILKYQEAYNERYALAVNLTLLSVQELPPSIRKLNEEEHRTLEVLRCNWVEKLEQKREDF